MSRAEEKDTKIFKHAKSSPEVAPHKSKWDRKQCKRNKGGPHNMVLVKDVPKTLHDYRHFNVPGFRVLERRPFVWHDREWRCEFCNRKEVNYVWGASEKEKKYTGEWVECRRTEVRAQR